MYLPNWEKDRVVSQKETMYDAYVSDYTVGPCLCTYIQNMQFTSMFMNCGHSISLGKNDCSYKCHGGMEL